MKGRRLFGGLCPPRLEDPFVGCPPGCLHFKLPIWSFIFHFLGTGQTPGIATCYIL